MKRTNAAGVALIKSFEGLRLEAYQDSARVWTIGYGHTFDVRSGDEITEQEAEELLLKDLAGAERAVEKLVKVELNDNEFSSLVSFVFNLGGAALQRSVLLKRLNAGDRAGAASEFARWVYASGKRLKGLERRRDAERELFLTPVVMTNAELTREVQRLCADVEEIKAR